MKIKKEVKLVKKNVVKVVTERIVTNVFVLDRTEMLFIRDLLGGLNAVGAGDAVLGSMNKSGLTDRNKIEVAYSKLFADVSAALRDTERI